MPWQRLMPFIILIQPRSRYVMWAGGSSDYVTRPSTCFARPERLVALSDEHRLRGFSAHGLALLGGLLCQRGELDEGMASISNAIETSIALSIAWPSPAIWST